MIRDDLGRDIIFGVEVCDGRPPTSGHVTATPPERRLTRRARPRSVGRWSAQAAVALYILLLQFWTRAGLTEHCRG